jgi:hypothetical protein
MPCNEAALASFQILSLSIIMALLRNAKTDFSQDSWKSQEIGYCYLPTTGQECYRYTNLYRHGFEVLGKFPSRDSPEGGRHGLIALNDEELLANNIRVITPRTTRWAVQ